MLNFRRLSLAAAALAFGVSGAWAQPQPQPSGTETVIIQGVGTITVLTYRAQVVSADPVTRRVVLEGLRGKRWAVVAPPMAGEIGLLRNGQSVVIRAVPAVVTALGKAHQGTPGEVFAEVAVNDGLPGLPDGFGARAVTLTTILVWIDKAAGTITFEGPDGQVRVVKALDAKVLADLQNVQPGDLSQITYLEALSIRAAP